MPTVNQFFTRQKLFAPSWVSSLNSTLKQLLSTLDPRKRSDPGSYPGQWADKDTKSSSDGKRIKLNDLESFGRDHKANPTLPGSQIRLTHDISITQGQWDDATSKSMNSTGCYGQFDPA